MEEQSVPVWELSSFDVQCLAFNVRCSSVFTGGGMAGEVLDGGFQAESDQGKECEQGGAGEGGAELVFIVEYLDMQRQRVGLSADVPGDHGNGSELAHRAGIAEQDAVE